MISSVILALLAGIAFYATKRYFDDRAASREVDKVLSKHLAELMPLLEAILHDGTFTRERLAVFEKALGNAITQFDALVSGMLKDKAKTAGAVIRMGRRMPPP